MEQLKSKGRGKKVLKVEAPEKLEPAPVVDTVEVEASAKLETVPVVDTKFSADKPDYIRMYCNRCGRRLTLKSQNPDMPGLGPYQGYCRFPCGVEYIVQVNLLG